MDCAASVPPTPRPGPLDRETRWPGGSIKWVAGGSPPHPRAPSGGRRNPRGPRRRRRPLAGEGQPAILWVRQDPETPPPLAPRTERRTSATCGVLPCQTLPQAPPRSAACRSRSRQRPWVRGCPGPRQKEPQSHRRPPKVRSNPAPERGWGGRAQGRARPSPLGARPESPVTRPRTPGPVGRPRAPGARSVSPASALLLGGPSPRQGHWGRARGAPGPRGRRGGPEPLRHAEISRLAAPATPESPRRLTPAGAPAPAPSVPSGSRQKKPPARPNRTARQE